MDLKELDKKWERIIKDIKVHNDGQIMTIVGVEALTMIKQRVIETGKDAHNKPFKPYSTRDMLVGRSSFKSSVAEALLGSKEKRRQLEWKTIGGSSGYAAMLAMSAGTSKGTAREGKGVRLAVLKGGYKKWRELMLGAGHGDKVDFSVTNRMWNDITLISSTSNHKQGVAIIGARLDEEKKKLAANTKRKGEILDLSQKEIEGLQRRYNLQVLKIFKENGLS